MKANVRPARVNMKAVVILVVTIGLVGAAVIGGHYARKRVMAQRAYNAGQAAFERGDLDQACRQLQRYLEQYPDDVEVLKTYADARLRIRPRTQTHVGAAIAALRRLLRHRRHDEGLYHQLAKLYLSIHDYKNAASVCLQLLEEDPANLRAHMNLARSRLGGRDFNQAIKILQPLIQKHPEEVAAYALLADAVVESDDSQEALSKAAALLNQCIERNPESPLAFVQRGHFHLDTFSGRKERDAEAAKADLARAETRQPVKPRVVLDLAHAWSLLDEPKRADLLLKQIRKMVPDFLADDVLDPDRFELEWYLVKSQVVRQLGVKTDMAHVATEGLSELDGRYRSAFMGNAIDLYLLAGSLDVAQRVLDEYRELITGSRQGGTSGDEPLSLLLARLAYARDRPYEVIDRLEPVVARNPKSYAGWRLLGQAYVVTKQSRRAIRVLEQCIKLRPDDESATMQLVKELLRQHQWARAMQYARTLGRTDLDARLVRLEASLRNTVEHGIAGEAVKRLAQELVALRKEHPESSGVRMLLAVLDEYENRHNDAIAELRAAIEKCDDRLAPAMQLAGLLKRLNRLDEAIEVCESASKRHGSVARPWIRLAEYLVRAERLDEARTTLKEAATAVTGSQQEREVGIATGRLYLRLGERERAIEKFKQIASEAPGDVSSRVALLELPEVLGKPGEAQRYVDELKKIEGGRSGVFWRLHQARTWLADPDWKTHEQDILEVLTHCMDADPDWTRPVLILGGMYERLEDPIRAEEVYRRMLEVKPDAIEVVDRLLRLLEQQNRIAEAKAVLDRLPSDLPGLTGHRVGLATAAGEFDTAIKELQRLVESDPRNAESRILLARLIYHDQHDAAEAFRLLDEAEDINPDVLAVSAVRAFVLLNEGRTEDATRCLDAQVKKRNDFASHLLRGQYYLARGRVDLAERDYQSLPSFLDQGAAGYEVLGRFYASQGRWNEAIQMWQGGLQVQPDRLSTTRLLVKALLVSPNAGQQAVGAHMLSDLLLHHPDDADLLGVRASLLLKKGSAEARREAKKVLQRVVELDGRAVKAHLALMQLETAEGHLSAASDIIARALGFNPEHPDLLMAQAELERMQRHLPRARELANLVLQQDPDRAEAYAVVADVAFQSHDLKQAATMSAEAARRAPQDGRIQLQRAAVLEAMNRRADAIGVLSTFTQSEAGQKDQAALLALADLQCQEGDYEAFDKLVKEVEQLRPESPGPVRERASCLSRQGRYEQIGPLLSQYRANFPKDTATLILGANLLASSGRQAYQREARLLFDYVVEVDPRSVSGHLGIAQTAYVLGDIDRAVEAYRRVLALDSNHHQALNDLAWILAVDEGDLKGAIDLADRGVERYPDDPHLLDTRGVVLTKLNRLAQAESDLILCVELAEAQGIRSTQVKALIHLAEVYEKRGESSSVRQKLEAAKAIDREFSVLTKEERADMEDRIGRL